jgi:hypothetical protein
MLHGFSGAGRFRFGRGRCLRRLDEISTCPECSKRFRSVKHRIDAPTRNFESCFLPGGYDVQNRHPSGLEKSPAAHHPPCDPRAPVAAFPRLRLPFARGTPEPRHRRCFASHISRDCGCDFDGIVMRGGRSSTVITLRPAGKPSGPRSWRRSFGSPSDRQPDPKGLRTDGKRFQTAEKNRTCPQPLFETLSDAGVVAV